VSYKVSYNAAVDSGVRELELQFSSVIYFSSWAVNKSSGRVTQSAGADGLAIGRILVLCMRCGLIKRVNEDACFCISGHLFPADQSQLTNKQLSLSACQFPRCDELGSAVNDVYAVFQRSEGHLGFITIFSQP